MAVFFTFITMLGICWVVLENVGTIAANIDLVPVFTGVEIHKDQIFKTICKDAHRVQDCSEAEKATIYGYVPIEAWFYTAKYLEETLKCSGFNQALGVYYFTNK